MAHSVWFMDIVEGKAKGKMTYDSLAQTGKGWSAYDNWAETYPVRNWSLAFILLIAIIIVIEKVRRK